MTELLKNPNLIGVDRTLSIGNRLQNIPPNWEVVQLGWSDTNPASEIYHQDPAGTQVLVAWRVMNLRFVQQVSLPAGRYLLKVNVQRNTEPPTGTQIQWGLYLEAANGAVFHFHNSSAIPSTSTSGEHLAVFQLNQPKTVKVGLLITTDFASLDGNLVIGHIGLEDVPLTYGTAVITLDSTDAPPTTTTPPDTTTPPTTTLPPVTTIPPIQLPPLPPLPLPPLEPLPDVPAWKYYNAMAMFYLTLSEAAKPQGVTNG